MREKKSNDWKDQLKQVVQTPEELIHLLRLPPDYLPQAKRAAALFPLRVPRGFIARMKPQDLHDPLLRQVLPIGEEEAFVEGFSTDPNRETACNPVPGLLHKYKGRVLLITAGACPINCRFCFRRHFPYEQNNPNRAGWQQAFNYIAADPTIHEVILSGGEPLLLDDRYLFELIEQSAAIPSVTTVRFHTRMPIMIPARITDAFCAALTKYRVNFVLVLHCNHPNEIDASVKQALQRLKTAGVTLLNQAVLLKGVNNQPETFITLNHLLFDSGVLPYYLHRLDPVQGAAHFAVSDKKAQALWRVLQRELPGYLVPRFVTEEPDHASKTYLLN